jgi:hypothetical protein
VESSQNGCPSVFATDRGTYVVQGWKITDPQARAAMAALGLPDHEDAVEIPAALLRHFPSSQS